MILDCGHPPSPHSNITTGYGEDEQGRRSCYACCAERDRKSMRETGKAALYLVKRELGNYVTNWPGSLSLSVDYQREGKHNMAHVRRDVWFTFEKTKWHGVQIGDNTQLCHVRRLK